ncbi:putative uncharacterized protein [Clostridium sp. CAG:411]|nr:DUF58 domain-containing protein [Lachnospiraceae bacterium]CDE44577.1 putative uncharacterized protein [Clostridium sp. CAG:411]
MNKNRVAYVLFVAVGIYLAILYDRYPSVIVLWLLVIVPLVSGIFIPFWNHFVVVSASLENTVEQQGEKGTVWITIENKTILPVLQGVCYLTYQHELEERAESIKVPFSINARDREKIKVPFQCEHCGSVTFELKKVRVIDYFGIFAYTKKMNEKLVLAVLPKCEETEDWQETSEDVSQQDAVVDVSMDLYAGNSEEQRDIREYRPGDSLKWIHWKVSSKRQQLMTREFEEEQGEKDILLFSMLYEKGETTDFAWYDKRIRAFAEVSMGKLLLNGPYEVIWFQPKEKQFYTVKVERQEQLYGVWEQMIRAGVGEKPLEYEMELKHYLQSGQKNEIGM